MSFESANRVLGENFSGSHHEVEIICRRLLQIHWLYDTKLKNDFLKNHWLNLMGQDIENDSSYHHAMKETVSLKQGRDLYFDATFFNRQKVNNVYFDSPCYSRAPMSGDCNSFVSFSVEGEVKFGQIMYFVSLPEEPFNFRTNAVIELHKIVEEIGPVKGILYRLENTKTEKVVSANSLRKVFRVKMQNSADSLAIRLCTSFDHS